MTEHPGHENNQAEPERESTKVRNGTRSKTVISDAAGEVDREETAYYRLWNALDGIRAAALGQSPVMS